MEDDCEMTPEASSSSNETPSEAENVHEQPTPEFLQRKIYFLSKLLQSSPIPLTYLHWCKLLLFQWINLRQCTQSFQSEY